MMKKVSRAAMVAILLTTATMQGSVWRPVATGVGGLAGTAFCTWVALCFTPAKKEPPNARLKFRTDYRPAVVVFLAGLAATIYGTYRSVR